MATPSVTFEVDRFEWTSKSRLEVAGRWFGLRGRRFIRPTLDIEVDGERRRMLALLEHKPWAADDGEHWIAAFAWTGDPVEAIAAELAVAPDLAVELPPPEAPAGAKKAAGAAKEATGATKAAAGREPATRREAAEPRVAADDVERLEARPPRAKVLETELSVARAEIEKLREQLERASALHEAEAEDLQRQLTAEQRAARRLATDLETAQEQIAAAEASSARQVQQLHRERDSAIAAREEARAETEQAARERDTAYRDRAIAEQARDAAMRDRAAAEQERDAAVRERAAAQQERDAAARARDKARHERNAWLSRARATLTELEAAATERDSGSANAATAGRAHPGEERETVRIPRERTPTDPGPTANLSEGAPAGAPPAATGYGQAPASAEGPPPPDRATARPGAEPARQGTPPPPHRAAASPDAAPARPQPATGPREAPGRFPDPTASRPPHPTDPARTGATRQLHTPLVQWRPGARRSMIPIRPGLLALAALAILVAIVIVLVLWAI
jgi:hypothetical protein